MASYRWVGAAGTWNTVNTANWAVTSTYITASCSGTTLTVTSGTPSIGQTIWQTSTGTSLGTVTAGSGSTWTVSIGGTYASQSMLRGTAATTPPTTADNVTFDNNGPYTVTMTGALTCANFSTNTTNGVTLAAGTSPTLTCAGTSFFSLRSNTTWSMGGTITFTGSNNITTNGVTVDSSITINGSGITITLGTAVTLGSSRTLTLTNGTLNLVGRTLTVGTRFTTATGTKNLTFNGGTLVCPNANTTSFSNAAPTNFTTTAGTGTGTISMTAATAKTFAGGGSTFNCTLNQGGLGALTITGANTFTNITNTVQPASVLFTAGTTSTFTDFNLSGTVGNLITIASVTAATHTLSKASGTVSSNYLSITNSIATGGATWNAGANSTNGGGNTGWIFGGPTGSFFSVL